MTKGQRQHFEPKFYFELGPVMSELRRDLKSYEGMLADEIKLEASYKELGTVNLSEVNAHRKYEALLKQRESLDMERNKLTAIRDKSLYRVAFCIDKMASFWPDIIFDKENGFMSLAQFSGYVREYQSTINACTDLKIQLRSAFEKVKADVEKHSLAEVN